MSVFEEIKASLEQAIAGEGRVLLTPEQQRNKELIERYPYLLPHNIFTDKVPEDYDYSYINGIGRADLFYIEDDELLNCLKAYFGFGEEE